MPIARKVSDGEPMSGNAIMDKSSPSLPRPIQEHLGRKLRAIYYEEGEKPVYLGDPVLPPELDSHLQRLEQRERIHNKGVEAVEEALSMILQAQSRNPHPIKNLGFFR
jgi:hypothetical protein